MASAKATVEITLDGVEIAETGSDKADTRHLLSVTLVWPRLAIAKKAATQVVNLEKGRVQLETPDWCDAILFKETVQGRFGVAVTLSEVLTDETLEAFLRFFGQGALTLASRHVDDWAGPIGILAASPLQFAAKQVGKTGQPPAPLVEGKLFLDTGDWSNLKSDFVTEIPLAAAQDIVELRRRTTGTHKTSRTVRKVKLARGEPNGSLRLLWRFL